MEPSLLPPWALLALIVVLAMGVAMRVRRWNSSAVLLSGAMLVELAAAVAWTLRVTMITAFPWQFLVAIGIPWLLGLAAGSLWLRRGVQWLQASVAILAALLLLATI